MGGGSSDGTNQANGQVNFAPSAAGGGSVMIGGNIGNAGVNQWNQNSASGASTAIDFSMPMPLPVLNLMNLQSTY
jgi:hypothetical protein